MLLLLTDMFVINRYVYVDRSTRNKFAVFSRTVELADELIKRVNNLGVYSLRRAKIGFVKVHHTELPPYEVEQEQIKTIEVWEAKAKEQ